MHQWDGGIRELEDRQTDRQTDTDRNIRELDHALPRSL